MARLADIVFDCEMPASLARWWASTLDGYRVAPYDSAELERLRDRGVFDPEDDPSVVVEPALGEGNRYLFLRVPEPKRHKNRLHLDLRSDDLEAEVTRLVDRGAVELYRIDTNVTMADPEDTESIGRVTGSGGSESAPPQPRWTVMADPEGNEFCVFPPEG